MATYTENYSLTKPSYGELADVAVLNQNMDTVDGLIHSNRTMLAPAFSQTENYAKDDIVEREGNLYRFIVDHAAGNWDATEVEQTTLGEEVSTKGGADVTKTASGNPIEITDGANAPLVKCVTAIQGNQDLHGYDKPWVGGAGKNKLENPLTSQTINYVAYTVNDNGSVLANGTASATSNLVFFENVTPASIGLANGTYILSGCPSGGGSQKYGLRVTLYDSENNATRYTDYGSGATFTIDATVALIRINIFVVEGITINATFYPMIRPSTVQDATYEPYSNICPITAYTEGEIDVRGKNLFDGVWEVGNIDESTGEDSANQYIRRTAPIIINGTSYVISNYNYGDTNNAFSAFCYDVNGAYLGFVRSIVIKVENGNYFGSFTLIQNSHTIRLRQSSSTLGNNSHQQLESGTVPTDYEEYKGVKHTATFSQSIYQGNADFIGGVATCNKIFVELKTLSYGGTSAGGLAWVDITVPASTKLSDILSDRVDITDDGTAAWQSTTPIIQYNSSLNRLRVYGSQALFTTGVYADAQMVYPLSTPTTETITPTNLPIKSLFGYNHIESSTGDMEVEYITEEFQPIIDLIEANSGKHVYSTNEQVVGTWTDGSTIYEKTIMHNNTTWGGTLDTGISDMKDLIYAEWCMTGDLNVVPSVTNTGSFIRCQHNGNGILSLQGGSFDADPGRTWYLTIRYTKSTPTRSLNLTKTAVEEIPDEIKNAEYEEKPDVNEADDDAPTEVDER